MSSAAAQRSYPAEDYHPNMVNIHRMQDVQAEHLRLLAEMLNVVLRQPRAAPASCQREGHTASKPLAGRATAAAAAPASAHELDTSEAGNPPRRARFTGYNPERVYRAVNALVVLEQTSLLQSLLDTHLAQYGKDVEARLAALPVAEHRGREPLTTAAEGAELDTAANSNTTATTAGEAAKKRRRLSQDSFHDCRSGVTLAAPCAATETGAGSGTSARSFASLVQIWRDLLSATDEVQAVWAAYAGRFESAHHRSATTLPSPAALQASGATGRGGGGRGRGGVGRSESNVLRAAVPLLADAMAANPALVEDALRGCAAAVAMDVARSRPIPGSAAVTAGPAAVGEDDGNEEGAGPSPDLNAMQRMAELGEAQAAAEEAQRRADLRDFTDLCVAVHVFEPRVVSVMVAAVEAHYQAAASTMMAAETPAHVYFSFASESLLAEQGRAEAYMTPHTAPQLREAVERTLLGPATGVEVLRRNFDTLFTECAAPRVGGVVRRTTSLGSPACAETGGTSDGALAAPQGTRLDTLDFTWRLYSSCVHAPREPVVEIFRHHVERMSAAAVEAIVRAVAAPVQRADASEAARAAVAGLVGVVRDVRKVMTRGFGQDQRVFQTQADECLQRVLQPHAEVVAEALAGFVDNVFRQLETGDMPLTLRDQSRPTRRAPPTEDEGAAGEEEESEGGGDDRTAVVGVGADGSPAQAQAVALERVSGESGEEVLGVVAYLCSHFPSIDQFERLHWRDMSRRLLHPYRRVNVSAERCFLRIFEGICGNSFISKFESMLRDMTTSETLTQEYKEWVLSRGTREIRASPTSTLPAPGPAGDAPPLSPRDFDELPAQLDLSLQFITSGLWPPYPALPVRLPPSLQRVVHHVECFYHRAFARRLLQWQHQLSHGVLRARLQPRAPWRQLSGTLLQCLMLLHLDEHLTRGTRSTTVGELCEALGVPLEAAEVMGSLLGLCHPRFPLLTCVSAGRGPSPAIQPTDTLAINTDFVFPAAKLRIPFQARLGRAGAAAAAGTAAGRAMGSADSSGAGSAPPDEEREFRERSFVLESAVMRFAKAQRKVSHEEVIAHLQTVRLPFTVQVAMVKRTLEKMIERGYLARKGPNDYVYVP